MEIKDEIWKGKRFWVGNSNGDKLKENVQEGLVETLGERLGRLI